MARRESAYTVVRIPADGGVSPNHYVPQITVEMKVFWPPGAIREEVLAPIRASCKHLQTQVLMKMREAQNDNQMGT